MTTTGGGGLTAELIARAIVAAALAYGDDPVKAMTGQRMQRRCVTAAASGTQRATGLPVGVVLRAFKVAEGAFYARRANPTDQFVLGEAAALRAVEYAGWRPEACASRKAPAPAQPSSPSARSSQSHPGESSCTPASPADPTGPATGADGASLAGSARPAGDGGERTRPPLTPERSIPDRPPPVRMKPPRGPMPSRAPKVTKLRPVSPGVLRFARRFRDAAWAVDDVAWLFDVAEDALEAALPWPAAGAVMAPAEARA